MTEYSDAYGRRRPPEPVTFQDRVAWAICAQEVKGGEGLLSDEEVNALEAIVGAVDRTYGSDKAVKQFAGYSGPMAMTVLRRLLKMERDRRRTKRDPLLCAHIIAADWPEYSRLAGAIISVLVERPEFASLMLSSPSPTGKEAP